jgi:hypothetical protein
MDAIAIRKSSPPFSFIIFYIFITLWVPGRKTKPVKNTSPVFLVV